MGGVLLLKSQGTYTCHAQVGEMWGQICLDCNTNNYAKIPKMGVNAPTWEGSKDESEILHQLCVDLPAYSKTKEQWLSKQWLTINFSLRFKFKGR